MERLTARNKYGGIVCALSGVHTDVVFNRLLHKLADYEDAEEQGRLFIAPVAIGQTIFRHVHCACGAWSVKELKVSNIQFYGGLYSLNDKNFNTLSSTGFGKYWFLTRTEAEAALEKTKGGGI